MKRIFILSLLLTLSLAAFPQKAEEVVRSYISTLNEFLLSPNTFSKRSAFENSLQNCLIQDGIYIKYKGNVSIDDCKGSDYAGIIADAINDNQRYSYAKVEIARSLQTTGSGSSYEVTAYLRYTGAIEMRTVTVFHIRSGKISAMTNDYIKTKEWNAGDKPTDPFTITSCTVSNVDSDGNTLPFDAAHTQYLKPEIRYTCNTSGSYDIYVKFYDASGSLSTGSSSPSGYSYKQSVSMSSGSGSAKLSGWVSRTSGNWRAGSYRFEFYYNGTKIYSHPFSVPEGTPTSVVSSGGSSGSSSTITVNGRTYGNMIFVKGGTFQMGATSEQGSDADSDEKPVHTVTLSDYYIGETEVTCGLWKAVMGSDASYFKKGDNYPVENVSWNDIQDFLTKLNSMTGKTYRLPTEAEWEYAARGGSKSRGYKYSGSNNLSEVAWYGYYDSSDKNRTITTQTTMPVKTKSPNELGLYDMSGNVYEWCNDWYKSDYYANSPSTNPRGPSPQSRRVLRGGSWYGSAGGCRVSFRYDYTPSNRYSRDGFRLALVP